MIARNAFRFQEGHAHCKPVIWLQLWHHVLVLDQIRISPAAKPLCCQVNRRHAALAVEAQIELCDLMNAREWPS